MGGVSMSSSQAQPQLQPQNQTQIVAQLQKQVANAFILYMNYKHYHWQVYGPLFRDMHLMFDEFAEQALESIDDFAERIRMIGEDPISSPEEVSKVTTMKVATKKQTLREMITEADENVKKIIVEMREGGLIANEDIGTVDLFSRVIQIYEKQEWWLRDILKKNDQLVV
jgi:starvation-inducible DNA-binding protein